MVKALTLLVFRSFSMFLIFLLVIWFVMSSFPLVLSILRKKCELLCMYRKLLYISWTLAGKMNSLCQKKQNRQDMKFMQKSKHQLFAVIKYKTLKLMVEWKDSREDFSVF
ncbi:uncharacterized protein LOC110720075 [Chenopodium quinoa]|uniref:uncharacterized protein LOC110720075 n=1 Tax=Chenopodium quinoa TaxID=63459 RepID=UPI000B7878C2|nr:uncharacterized protein LOC110720075 [Chenopodium quinoa]